MVDWPDWWSWELELSPHVLKRMIDRAFIEVDLRLMFEVAAGYDSDVVPGRDVVHTRHGDDAWDAIVEPLRAERVLLVITAYPVGLHGSG